MAYILLISCAFSLSFRIKSLRFCPITHLLFPQLFYSIPAANYEQPMHHQCDKGQVTVPETPPSKFSRLQAIFRWFWLCALSKFPVGRWFSLAPDHNPSTWHVNDRAESRSMERRLAHWNFVTRNLAYMPFCQLPQLLSHIQALRSARQPVRKALQLLISSIKPGDQSLIHSLWTHLRRWRSTSLLLSNNDESERTIVAPSDGVGLVRFC